MSTVQIKKIKDVEEFTKLFKINIPVTEEFGYYINTLKKSREYSAIDMLVDDFIGFEEWVVENGHSGVHSYKMKTLDLIKDYILGTTAYALLQEKSMPGTKFEKRDWLNQNTEGEMLLSLDFKSANYSVLKTFDDIKKNELKESWEKLCDSLGVHKMLASSKSFRQLVFGNTNPKRLQVFQQESIMKVVKHLKDLGYNDDIFVFISHDEIILKVFNASDVLRLINDVELFSKTSNKMVLRSTLFSLKKLRKNTFIKTKYYIQKGIIDDESKEQWTQPPSFQQVYKTLHGVPGNKFYMFFKEYILGEALEDRDLLYYSDDELCKWVVEEKRNKIVLPHYEKPKHVISIEQAKNDYSYVWNEITKLLPHMSNEEKRRVVEVISNSCQQCFSAPYGCRCWKDE